jgi:hypothetical protein
MRRSALVHRFLPEGTTGETGFATLVDAGYVVALGPGLVAGTPLFDRVVERVETAVFDVSEGLGVQRASLPACEGEALVNLLAHLGWVGARTGLAALGTGFRELTVEPDGLHGLALYRRLDIVRLEGGVAAGDPPVTADLTAAVLGVLGKLGVPDPKVDDGGVLSSRGTKLGGAVRRSLDDPTADALLLLDLDLFAVVGVLADHHRDDRGLAWPAACAPYLVALIEAAGEDPVARETSAKLEAELAAAGLSVLRDDTSEPAATQRRAAERLGIPVRVLCGPTCGQGVVVLERREGGTPERVPVADVVAWVERSVGLVGRGAAGRNTGRNRRLRALY